MSQRRRGSWPWDPAQIAAEEGVDPAVFFFDQNTRSRRGRAGRKTLQLCRQVQRAVEDFLADEQVLDDPLLSALWVMAVEPAPDAGRLRVVFACEDHVEGHFDVQQAHDRLKSLRGVLRIEVGASICRKRVPELTFCVLQPGEVALSHQRG